jgi:FtsP/CotA-like multicopper oxidase with cupredoxin domain
MPVAPDPTPFLRAAPRRAPAGEAGWKDTVMAHPGELVRILVPFGGRRSGVPAPFDGDLPAGAQRFVGDYVWHCHILEHEENDMMLRYRVRPRA